MLEVEHTLRVKWYSVWEASRGACEDSQSSLEKRLVEVKDQINKHSDKMLKKIVKNVLRI